MHTLAYEPQGKIMRAFHESRARFRVVIGPLGSGKTTGTIVEFLEMINTHKAVNGVRKSRWAILRNTFPDLLSTTIRDWLEIVPPDLGKFQRNPTIEHILDYDLPDGTRVQAEILFLAQDKPDDVKKLRGLQLTGAWCNEAKELPKSAFDMLDSRIGRFPRRAEWGDYFAGIVADTNAPDADHWLGRFALEDTPTTWEFFIQPPAAFKRDGRWHANPNADNVANLPEQYYDNLIQGKKEDWIRSNVANEFVEVIDGRPVHPDFQRHLHVEDEYLPTPSMPLVIGMDFGRTPAAVFLQRDPEGTMHAFREYTTENTSVFSFGQELSKRISRDFPNYTIEAWGDPSGTSKTQARDEDLFDVLNATGIEAFPAPSNDPDVRYSTLDQLLRRIDRGEAKFKVTKECKVLIRGLAGGFQFRRMQVPGLERFQDKADKNFYSHVCEALHYGLLGAGEGERAFGNPWQDETHEIERDEDFTNWAPQTGLGSWREHWGVSVRG